MRPCRGSASQESRAVQAASAAGAIVVAAVCVPAARPAPAAPGPVAPSRAWIAHLVAPVEARSAPAAGRLVTRLDALAPWNHGPVGLLVPAARTGRDGQPWLRGRLPPAPNGAAAGTPANRTRLTSTGWRIVVSVGRRTVAIERKGKVVHVYRAVVGKQATPTPTGLFAVSERISQPDPHGFYGPWVLLLT